MGRQIAAVRQSGQIQGISKEEIDKTVAPLEELRARLEQKKIEFTVGVETEPEGAFPDLTAEAATLGETVEEVEDIWTRAFESAEQSTKGVNEAIAGSIPQLLRASGAVEDFSDPFVYLTRNMDASDRSIEAVLRKAHRLSALDIDLSIDEQEALKAAAALRKTESAIEALDGEIANNASDMGMWESRIAFVDDTLGSAENTLAEYQWRLAQGQITQEEFNEAVASGEAHESYAEINELVREST